MNVPLDSTPANRPLPVDDAVSEMLEKQLKELAHEEDDTQESDKDPTHSLREELGSATLVQDNVDKQVDDFFKRLFAGQEVQVETLRQGVRDILSSVLRQEQAMLGLTLLNQRGGGYPVHAVNVSTLMMIFAKFLGEPPQRIETLGQGGLFHDLGITRVSETILDKTGPLSVGEVKALNAHVPETLALLDKLGIMDESVRRMAAQHHERLDGSGHPQRLKGNAISLEGRMAAIVNDFENLTGPRPYRKSWPHHDALRNMMTMTERHYDKMLFQKFVQCVGVYPIGTILRLKNRIVVMVVANNTTHLLHPIVRVLTDSFGKIVPYGQWINLVDKSSGPAYKIDGPTSPPAGIDPLKILRQGVKPA
ncbi:MAG: HD-GYP domain-containing protein [Magnetococcales bacterium]|nr:HD-GYP domain-containing protein [Magnetococcales bacterium]